MSVSRQHHVSNTPGSRQLHASTTPTSRLIVEIATLRLQGVFFLDNLIMIMTISLVFLIQNLAKSNACCWQHYKTPLSQQNDSQTEWQPDSSTDNSTPHSFTVGGSPFLWNEWNYSIVQYGCFLSHCPACWEYEGCESRFLNLYDAIVVNPLLLLLVLLEHRIDGTTVGGIMEKVFSMLFLMPLAEMYNLASGWAMVDLRLKVSSDREFSLGSVQKSLQTFSMSFASMSRIWLCRMYVKPPLAHDSAWFIELGLEHAQVFGRPFIGCLYRKRMASVTSCCDKV